MTVVHANSKSSHAEIMRRVAASCWAATLFVLGVGCVVWYGLPLNVWPAVPVAGALVVVIDAFAVRDRAEYPLSMAGVVLLTMAIYNPHAALLLALLSGLLIKTPRTWETLREVIGQRLAESGGRTLALALVLSLIEALPLWGKVIFLMGSYVLVVQAARCVFSLLWVGPLRLQATIRLMLPSILLIEVLPLPLAALGAEIARSFALPLVAVACGGLVGSAMMVRRGARSLGQQRRAVAELGQINAISRAIIRAELDVDALCNLIYAEAAKVVDATNFRLGLFNGRFFELKVRVQDGEREAPLSIELTDDRGIVSWMRRTGRSLLVDDFETEMAQLPAQPTYQADVPPRSGIYIPLLTGDTVLGTVSIQSRAPHAFDSDDLRLLSLIADQAAIAIDKARAYAAARRRAAQLATISEVSRQVTAILDLERLLPSVVNRIRASFGYYHVHLFTVDYPTQELVFRASTNGDNAFWRKQGQRLAPGMGIVGHVAQTGEPMLVNDVRDEPRFIPDQPDIAAELAVPMRIGSQLIGVLDVQSNHYGMFDENDFFVLQTLADQIAIAIDSANLFQAQQEEAWVLNALLQSAENIARIRDTKDLLDVTVRLPALLLGCDRALCLLWNRDDHVWTLAAAWGLSDEERAQVGTRTVPEANLSLLTTIRTDGEAQLIPSEAQSALCSAGLIPKCNYGALLALPLTARATTLGVLLLDRLDPEAEWSARQITIGMGIAGQAASAIEGALLANVEVERQHLEQEINVAREIQVSLLPSKLPHLPGWESGARWQLARQVGGDFYDFWQFHSGAEAGNLGFVIADVSDKGVPAALFMALSRSLVRGAALDGTSPAKAMERANRWIMRDSQSLMFVTLFYGIINPRTGQLRYTCAGHNPPLLYRAASHEMEPLRTPGIALGVIEDAVLGEAQTIINPGDVLVCYTDGVTEAVNEQMEEWGVPSLITAAVDTANGSVDTVLETISTRLALHTGDLPPFDDITLVVIKRLRDEPEGRS